MVTPRAGIDRVVPWVGALGAIALVASAIGGALGSEGAWTEPAAGAGVLGVLGWAIFDLDRVRRRGLLPSPTRVLRTLGPAAGVVAAAGLMVLGTASADRVRDVTRHGDHGPSASLQAALDAVAEAVDPTSIAVTIRVRGHGDSVDRLHEAELEALAVALRIGAPEIDVRIRDVADAGGAPGSLTVTRGDTRIEVPSPDMDELADALRRVAGVR